MTLIWFVAIAVGMAGVFALFWWLVELTGGIAGQALSVSRSVQAGLVTWLESPAGSEATMRADDDPAPVAFDASGNVPTERVRPEHRR